MPEERTNELLLASYLSIGIGMGAVLIEGLYRGYSRALGARVGLGLDTIIIASCVGGVYGRRSRSIFGQEKEASFYEYLEAGLKSSAFFGGINLIGFLGGYGLRKLLE